MYKLKKRLDKIIFHTKRILLNKRHPSYYSKKGRELLEKGNIDKATRILKKGLNFYPNSVLIHYEYALIEENNENWKKAVHHWSYVFKSKNNNLKNERNFERYIKALEQNKQIDKAIKVSCTALKKYKNNKKLQDKKIKLLTFRKCWEKAVNILLQQFEMLENDLPSSKYIQLSELYVAQKLYDKAEYILREGLMKNIVNKELLEKHAEILIYKQEWENALKRYNYLLSSYENEIPVDILIKVIMIEQIIGNHNQANQQFQTLLNDSAAEIKSDELGYRKIVLYDNGDSRIEFYKNLKQVNKVVVSFDSLYMDWNEPAFGFKFLVRQDVDIIAVRRREKGSFQQDLSQEDFISTVETLVSGYEDKIAYGHSLGAYSALYFGSTINCRILAMAPRISIHPTYGRNIESKYTFKHNLKHTFNDQIYPIIVYDPKSPLDNTYIEEEVLRAFPNSELVKLPYGGHGIARHLLRMGVLKDYIYTVINGEIPKYNRKLKGKSGNYLRLLGRACLRRGKLTTATELSERAIKLLPQDKYCIKLKVDVLKAGGKFIEATEYINDIVKSRPNNIYFRHIIIDLYTQQSQLIKAEQELKRAIETFGEIKSLINRLEKINKKRLKIIKEPLDIYL